MTTPITTEYEVADELQRRMLDLEETYEYSPPAQPDPVATEAARMLDVRDGLIEIFQSVDRECIRISLGII